MRDVHFYLNKCFVLLPLSVNHRHKLALLSPDIFKERHRGQLFDVLSVEFSVREQQKVEFFEGVEVREVPVLLLLFLFLIIIIVFLVLI